MHTEEHTPPIVWSAATCDFKGAGVYVGLAPEYEHFAVARGLSAKQMQAYVGGRVRACGEPRPWPIHYYAIRDPSAVRVIPIHLPPLPNGFKPIHLRFRFPLQNGRSTITISPPRDADVPGDGRLAAAPAAFIVTVGLPLEREETFFRETIDRHVDQEWEQIFARVAAQGCRDFAA